MEHRKQITSKSIMRSVVMGGKSTFTLVSTSSGTRFTYKFSTPKEQLSDGNTDFDVIFIKVLSGSDNETGYQYLGQVFPKRSGLQYNHGRKSRVGDTAPSVKAIRWFLHQLQGEGSNLNKVEFWHEGRCARCGRKLTVPESVETGFGPDCAVMMHVPYGRLSITVDEAEAEMHRIEVEADREQTVRDEINKMKARVAF